MEIKGLIATYKCGLESFAPYFELWSKWSLQASMFEMAPKVIMRKIRRLRAYDASSAAAVEIPLRADEAPVSGRPLPEQGCNVEITKIEFADEPRPWWTLGFEAYGDLDSAPCNLRKTAQLLVAQSFPRPSGGEFLSYPSWLARIKP